MAQGNRTFRRGAPKRLTQWIGLGLAADAVDNSSVLSAKLNATALALRPFTVIRTHIEILQQTDQSTASEDMGAAFGMCVVSESASGAGVASVPTPITDADSDLFFVHQWMIASFLLKTAVGVADPSGTRYTIDSKAMRKVNNDQDVIIVVEGDSSGEGMVINSAGRMLIKLH